VKFVNFDAFLMAWLCDTNVRLIYEVRCGFVLPLKSWQVKGVLFTVEASMSSEFGM